MRRPILVTGGAGFIGRHLVAALRSQGTPVRVLVRQPERARDLAASDVELVEGDLLEGTSLPRAVAGIGAVFHVAGRLFVPGTPTVEYERLHVEATAALVNACADLDRLEFFVLCSTTGIHGPTGAVPAREDDPGRPDTAYEVTKARGERAAVESAARAGVPLSIARPGLVYGPGDRHLLPLFRAIGRGYYRVIGAGTNQLHPIYIADLIDGLLRVASRGGRAGRAYHLVGPRPVTMRELSDAIAAAMGTRVSAVHLPRPIAWTIGAALEALPLPRRRLPLSRSRVRFMTQNRAYDGSRAREELDFSPAIDLPEGLARTVEWYRRHRLL